METEMISILAGGTPGAVFAESSSTLGRPGRRLAIRSGGGLRMQAANNRPDDLRPSRWQLLNGLEGDELRPGICISLASKLPSAATKRGTFVSRMVRPFGGYVAMLSNCGPSNAPDDFSPVGLLVDCLPPAFSKMDVIV
jgi:hypothetical protein